jgi:hypothetical protein
VLLWGSSINHDVVDLAADWWAVGVERLICVRALLRDSLRESEAACREFAGAPVYKVFVLDVGGMGCTSVVSIEVTGYYEVCWLCVRCA